MPGALADPTVRFPNARGTFARATCAPAAGGAACATQPRPDSDAICDDSWSAGQLSASGPYEDESCLDATSAQVHYAQREIKLRDPRGAHFEPLTSYKEHYPPKELGHRDATVRRSGLPGARFTATSEYAREYTERELASTCAAQARQPYVPQPGQLIGARTTAQRHFQAWPVERLRCKAEGPPPAEYVNTFGIPVDDTFLSTHRAEFGPKSCPYERVRKIEPLRPQGPMMVNETTHNHVYKPHDLPATAVIALAPPPQGLPLDARTTYGCEFGAKALPQRTVISGNAQARNALALPLPRRSLGVEVVGDNMFTLLPASLPAPCSARQIFTNVNDNQEQACILVLYGESATASANQLLGQFDLVNLPPLPRDTWRIEVTFSLSADLSLSVTARDLDCGRHKLWKQNGGTVVLR